MQKQLLYKLHLWLSLPLGLLISLICLSGATLVFKNEIRDALGMPRVVAPHGMGDKMAKADKMYGWHSHRDTRMQEDSEKGNMKYREQNGSRHGTTTKRDFFSYVTKFHTGLLMGAKGKLIVTYTTLLFAFILISGILLHFPRNFRQLRSRFVVEWHKGLRRRIFDLHVSLGWWVTLWLLLLAVTGLGFGFKLVPKGSEMMQVFHQLHIGSWGGIVTKVITFIVSLVGASLPLTGYWLYFKKRCIKHQ